MTYSECPRCHEWTWAECRCRSFWCAAAEWDISSTYQRDANGHGHWGPPYTIEWHEQHALTAEDAAANFVRDRDQDGGEGMSEQTHVLVSQQPELTPDVKFFCVTGELVPEYWANDDKWEHSAVQSVERAGANVPDAIRPQTKLGEHYYDPERIAARAATTREHAEWLKARHGHRPAEL